MKNIKLWFKYELPYQYEKKRDNFYIWCINALPKRLVMWCYIRISGLHGEGPCDCFKDRLERWGVK